MQSPAIALHKPGRNLTALLATFRKFTELRNRIHQAQNIEDLNSAKANVTRNMVAFSDKTNAFISEALQSSTSPEPDSTHKTFIEEFGDTIKVDNITYLECQIALNRGVTFKWIKDVDNVSYKVFLKDQDFTQ